MTIKERLRAFSNMIDELQKEREERFANSNESDIRLQDLVKDKDYQILELKQRHNLESQGEPLSKQPSLLEPQSSGQSPNILKAMQADIKRFREVLEHKEYYISQLLNDYEYVRQQLEQEKRLKQDSRLERHYKAALDDLKRYEDSYGRLKKESDEIIIGKNVEIERLMKSINEVSEKFEVHIGLLEKDIKRLRKERDSSRELYEQLNSQMSLQVRIVDELKTTLKNYETENSELRKRISSERSSDDEIVSLCEAFEVLEKQLTELSEKFAEREELISSLKADKLKTEFEASQVNRQLDQQLTKLKSSQASLNVNLSESMERESKLRAKVIQLEERMLSLAAPAPVKHSDRDHEVKADNAGLTSNSDLEVKIKGLKHESVYLRTELDNTRKAIDEIYANGGVNVQELKDQIDLYRKLLKCNSCKTRDKNAIITKCMHVFCRDCLDTRIETRQRKCPNCGEPFGQGDIKNIYL